MKEKWVPVRFRKAALTAACCLRRFIPQKDIRKMIMKVITDRLFHWESEQLRQERTTAFAFEFILGEVHQYRMMGVLRGVEVQVEKWGDDEMDVGDQQGRPASEMRLRKFYYSRSFPHMLWWWTFPR